MTADPKPAVDRPPVAGSLSIDAPEITSESFAQSFGEDIHKTLDVDTWTSGQDLAAIYSRTEAEVRDAVEREEALLQAIRAKVFPRIGTYPGAPNGAGVYAAEMPTLEKIHRGLLFNRGVRRYQTSTRYSAAHYLSDRSESRLLSR